MPSGEDVTGLHAFDDLDPVSTLSALSAMPEPEFVPAQRAPSRPPQLGSTPPPFPVRASGSGLGIDAVATPSGRVQVAMPPPPPRGGLGSARSVPPPPAARGAEAEGDEDSFEDTRVMSQADFDYAEADLGPPSTSDESRDRTGIDDTELLELSATTAATKIEMDWDEVEVETKLRDDSEAEFLPTSSNASVSGRPSPFPPVTSSAPFSGNPSPFVPLHSSYPPPSIAAPEHDEWEDDEDARTRIMIAPSFRPPPSLPPAMPRTSAPPPPAPIFMPGVRQESSEHQSWSTSLKNNRMTWIGFGAVGLIAAAIVTRALTAAPDPATVTLVIKPADAQVLIDGKTLVGQTSPFTLPGLEPGIPHTIELSKDGYAVQRLQFSLAEGEVKPLSGIELVPLRIDTGFSIASNPAGASVYVDGKRIDQVTPLRVTDLSEGLHVVRLELGRSYQPWETQVALAKGQVIELPSARLIADAQVAPREPNRAPVQEHAQVDTHKRESTGASSGRRSGGSSGGSSSSNSHTATAPRASVSPAPVQIAAAGGGSQGVLRVNSRPWSQVFVDGRMVGNTPQLNIALASGKHKIKLVNPQLGMSKGFDVGIQAGKATTKVVELE